MRRQQPLKDQILIGSKVLVCAKDTNYVYCVNVSFKDDKEIRGFYTDLNFTNPIHHIRDTVFPYAVYQILHVFRNLNV